MSAPRIERLLDTLIAQKGSMLMLAVGTAPKIMREDRETELRMPALDADEFMACLAGLRAISPSLRIHQQPPDFAFVHDDVLMRCRVMADNDGPHHLIVQAMV